VPSQRNTLFALDALVVVDRSAALAEFQDSTSAYLY